MIYFITYLFLLVLVLSGLAYWSLSALLPRAFAISLPYLFLRVIIGALLISINIWIILTILANVL